MYHVYSTLYVEDVDSNYNCYVDEKEWLNISSELNSSRLFAHIINGDKSWICALGNPIRTGNSESFPESFSQSFSQSSKQLFVPEWMLSQINYSFVGETLEVQWMSADVFDKSQHIILEPFTDISGIEYIDILLQNELTLLGVLQKGTLINIDYNDTKLMFLVKDLMPASVVLCEGDEVSLEFYKDPPPPPPPPTPSSSPPSSPSPSPSLRFNPWRNKDFKPNLS